MRGTEIVLVDGLWGRLAFAKAARRIQKGDPNYVPPLLPEILRTLDPRKNPFFRHAEAALWIARRGREPAGRIATIVDRLHDETHGERCGFFGYFECEEDAGSARALLETAREWLRAKGAAILRGPVNLSLNNECGLLVEGFDKPPAVMTPHNPPYYAELLEAYGLRPVQTLLGYETRYEELALERLERISSRTMERGRFTVRTIDMGRFDEEVATIGSLFNRAWAENWGFVPATEEEFRFTAKGLKPIVVPEFVLFAESGGKPVGFILAIPDANRAIRAIDGRLFPFGIFRLPFLLRKVRALRLPLFGVVPSHRQAGIEGALLLELIRRGGAKGYHSCDCSWILEGNVRMRRAIEAIGGRVYKKYKIYEMPVN